MPMIELDEVLNTADVVLLAPQIHFAEKQIKKQLPKSTYCMVISSQDFGMMNATKVLDQIQQALFL